MHPFLCGSGAKRYQKKKKKPDTIMKKIENFISTIPDSFCLIASHMQNIMTYLKIFSILIWRLAAQIRGQ